METTVDLREPNIPEWRDAGDTYYRLHDEFSAASDSRSLCEIARDLAQVLERRADMLAACGNGHRAAEEATEAHHWRGRAGDWGAMQEDEEIAHQARIEVLLHQARDANTHV